MTILPATLDEMKRCAREAAVHAYAPYSGFPVGAAVLWDGVVQSGANVENVSYGLSICAERNAIFSAVACGARRIDAVVLYTPTDSISTPCGGCLQVIAEFGPDALIVCCSDGGDKRYTLRELLPAAFSAPQLAKR